MQYCLKMQDVAIDVHEDKCCVQRATRNVSLLDVALIAILLIGLHTILVHIRLASLEVAVLQSRP